MRRLLTIFFSLAGLAAACRVSAADAAPERRDAQTGAPAADSLRVFRAVAEHASPAAAMKAPVRGNPAVHAGAFAGDLSQVEAGYLMRREDAAARMQYGDAADFGLFSAESYRRLSDKSFVWGDAGYRRGVKRDVVWNSSSDYDLIFPYVTADSIGGDLTSEQYTFGGGYGRRGERFGWGLEGDLRALHEYRDYDPRPQNISIDLAFRGGAAVRTGDYRAGLSFAVRVYKQTGDVDFYNPQGVKGEYHLSGLGAHYARFMGVDAGSHYRGRGYTLTATLSPDGGGDGAYVTAAYERFSVEKILVSYNNLPLQRAVPQSMRLDAAWTGGGASRVQWGASVSGRYDYRAGYESIVGEKISNIYAVAGEMKMYEYSLATARAEAFVGREGARGSWYAVPWAEYRRRTEDYIYPAQNRNVSDAGGGADFVVSRTWRRTMLRAEAGAAYRAAIDGSLSIPVADMEPSMADMVRYDYNRAMLDSVSAHVRLRADRALGRGLSLFVAADYALGRFGDGTLSHAAGASVGIAF